MFKENMTGKKIFNDPVYGFVSIPYGTIFQLIEHPYFQRLRRIKQVSLTHYVYPGALHTRFHHALGAFHLMTQAIEILRSKGAFITEEEAEAVSIAILLHDIGHGPFSHTLENSLIQVHHESLSLAFMEKLNQDLEGKLDLAIQIFKDEYPKKFLHQLVSGQLDMDRMDYLNRDSFFTGVHEGVIGYDRIIKMLAVSDGELVIEEKGIYSIEKFLVARRLMYWQVYLHKTVLSAEHMLIMTMRRAKYLSLQGRTPDCPSRHLAYFLEQEHIAQEYGSISDEVLEHFARLDDFDIISALKNWMYEKDPVLAFLATGLINRRLFKLELSHKPFDRSYVESIRQKIEEWGRFSTKDLPYLICEGKESNSAYSTYKEEIKITFKNGEVRPMSEVVDHGIQGQSVTKYFLGYPKEVLSIRG
jgi:HD superfamily phosphohydrolase